MGCGATRIDRPPSSAGRPDGASSCRPDGRSSRRTSTAGAARGSCWGRRRSSTAGADILCFRRVRWARTCRRRARKSARSSRRRGRDIFLDRRRAPSSRARDEGRRHCTCSRAWWRLVTRGARGQIPTFSAARARLVDVRARAADEAATVDSYKPDATIQTADFGVFIDFMSMHQPDSGGRTAEVHHVQQARAEGVVRSRARQHRPLVRPRGNGRVQADGDAAGDRTAIRTASTTGGAGRTSSGASATSRRRRRTASTCRRGRQPSRRARQEDKLRDRNHLAAPRRRSAAAAAARVGGGARRAGRPRLCFRVEHAGRADPRRPRRASSPADFEEELKEKVFSFDADRTVCAGLYRGVAEPLLALLAAVDGISLAFFKRSTWTAADWRRWAALACCTKLRELNLRQHGRGRCGDGGVLRRARQRRGARARDARLYRPRLERDRRRGDAPPGSDALARGAAPALEKLNLSDEPRERRRPASGAKDALKNRK